MGTTHKIYLKIFEVIIVRYKQLRKITIKNKLYILEKHIKYFKILILVYTDD